MMMAMRLAAAGHQVGLSEAQILGFATALSSVGIEAEMGGSAFSKALVKMEVAAATGGEALEDFAKVSGMTADQFKMLWDADPAAAFQAFIVGLSQMDEQGMSAIARLESPLTFFALCTGIWTCNFLQIYWLLPCFAELDAVSLADMLHVFAAASVGVLLPTPAGAGPWHFAIVKTLTGVYGAHKAAAQSLALISHGLKTALVMLLGAWGYASYYRSVWKHYRETKSNE